MIHNQLSSYVLQSDELPYLLTPALAIYPDRVDSNIEATLRLLGGRTDRWQPHVKTAKLERSMRQYCDHGVKQFKCATTLEMLVACRAGATEVLMAYPCTGITAERVREIAAANPHVRICAMVENGPAIQHWIGSAVSLYINVNPGMNRTGIDQARVADIVSLASDILQSGLMLEGLHYYDGHHRQPEIADRTDATHRGYDQLVSIIEALQTAHISVKTVITSGTPTFPCGLSYSAFEKYSVVHRFSPGTIIYNDLTSLSQLPEDWGYQFAALVITSVVSHPGPGLVTCDAGHKAMSADAGYPNCAVLGFPEFQVQHPSEEHLPIRIPQGMPSPEIGTVPLSRAKACLPNRE